MTHDEAAVFLPGYVDAELDGATARALSEHLLLCEVCREEHGVLQDMKAAVREEGRFHRAPAALRAAFSPAPRPLPSSRLRSWWQARWLSPALAAGVAAGAASLVTLELVNPSIPDRTAEAVVANHVRSLMTGHVMDVVSTDKHTVKPWFTGRLAFSPPVEDFAAKGFPLAGGRVDYLEERPVAALVYQRGGHVIDVYVRPNEEGRPSAVKEMQRNGFNVLDWSDRRFTFDAVSDLNTAELRELANDLADAAHEK